LKKNFDRYFPEEMKNFSRRTGLQIHFRATWRLGYRQRPTKNSSICLKTHH
jgi:hypothetical protein